MHNNEKVVGRRWNIWETVSIMPHQSQTCTTSLKWRWKSFHPTLLVIETNSRTSRDNVPSTEGKCVLITKKPGEATLACVWMICDVCTQLILINVGIKGKDYFPHRRCGARHIQLSASISHWLITWSFLFRLKQWAVELLMFEERKERLYNKIVEEGNKTKWNYLERRKWNFHFVQNCLQEGSAISFALISFNAISMFTGFDFFSRLSSGNSLFDHCEASCHSPGSVRWLSLSWAIRIIQIIPNFNRKGLARTSRQSPKQFD